MTTAVSDEHPFAQYVRILGKGKKGARSLTQEEARDAMANILGEQADPMQVGAFLMLLRVKEESPEELAGFVEAARRQINAPDIQVDIDWSSYAGKRRHLPWFLLAAFALADNGLRVFMHGTQGHTSQRLYTEEALKRLGGSVAENWQQAATQLDKQQFSYLPLRQFCPQLDSLIHLKPVLGLRSVAHTMARLLNPLQAEHSLQSIFHPAYGDKHRDASLLLQQPNMTVFKGDGGEIERRPEATCLLKGINQHVSFDEEWVRLVEGKQADEDLSDLNPLLTLWHSDDHRCYGYPAVMGTLAIVLRMMGRATDEGDAFSQAETIWQARDPRRLPATLP